MKTHAFIHIPKNAGMSLLKAFGEHDEFQTYGHGVIFRSIPKTQKQVIVLREPIDRFSSAFFYVKKHYVKNLFSTPEDLVSALYNMDERAMQFTRFHKYHHRVNDQKIPTDWVFHHQHAWMDNPHTILFFERLSEDVERLADEMKIKVDIPKINASPKVEFEYSSDSISFLTNRYRKDKEIYWDLLTSNKEA